MSNEDNNKIIEDLKDLVEYFKEQDTKIEYFRTSSKLDRLGRFESEVDDTFHELYLFFKKNFEYNIAWLEQDIRKTATKKSSKYDITTRIFFCDFLKFMMNKGISKTQSINLLSEIMDEKTASQGFFREVSETYNEYIQEVKKENLDEPYEYDEEMINFLQEIHGKDYKETKKNYIKYDYYSDIVDFTSDIIKYAKNKDIQNHFKNKITGKTEKAFDDAVELYYKIWNDAFKLFQMLPEYMVEEYKTLFPKNIMLTKINKNYKDSKDFLYDLMDTIPMDDKTKKDLEIDYKYAYNHSYLTDYVHFMNDINHYIHR